MRIKVLYIGINQKLFSRADVAHHKIDILLKGHLTIYKKIRSSYERLNNLKMNGSTI